MNKQAQKQSAANLCNSTTRSKKNMYPQIKTKTDITSLISLRYGFIKSKFLKKKKSIGNTDK